MIPQRIETEDEIFSPKMLLSLARRTRQALNRPAAPGSQEPDPIELQALLQQVARLEHRLRFSPSTDLARWLERVRLLIEDRRQQISSAVLPRVR